MPAPPTAISFRCRAADEAKKAKAIQAKADEEGRDLTPEELAQIDTHLAETEKLNKEYERRDRLERKLSEYEPAARPGERLIKPSSADDGPDRKIFAVARDHEEEARGGFKNLGDLCMAVAVSAKTGAPLDPRLRALQMHAAATGMSGAFGADGGFLLPGAVGAGIWDGLGTQVDALLPRTDVQQVDGAWLEFNALDDTTHAGGAIAGGLVAYWRDSEGASKFTGSKPAFRKVRVEPRQLYAVVYCTDTMLESVGSLNTFLNSKVPQAINFAYNEAIINGTGAGQPKGFRKSAAILSVAKETSQAAATFLPMNAIKMWARLHPNARANAVWLMNPDVEPQIWANYLIIKNAAGSENVAAPSVNIFNPSNMTILGRPVIATEHCAALGTQGDIILCDLKGYLAGVRGGMQAAVSVHARFEYGETVFRWTTMLDGQTWLASAFTPKNGATLSQFVQLDTRA